MYAYTVLMLYFITNRETGKVSVKKNLKTFSSKVKAVKFAERMIDKIIKNNSDAEYDSKKRCIYLLTDDINLELNFYFYKTVLR